MIAIVGLGLIGTSLGLAWRRAGLQERIIGIDPDGTARDTALARGAVVEAFAGLQPAAGARVIVVAAPPAATLALAGELAPLAGPGTVVTDVCSVKAPVVARYEAALGAQAAYVGGHPMSGKAVGGAGAAEAGLFAGRPWILTPTAATDPEALARVEALVRAAGARLEYLDAEEHDRRVARLSHLPQVTATALMLATAGGDLERLAGPGLRDTTRLAGSPGGLWAEVLVLNAGAVVEAADAFMETFTALVDAVRRGDARRVEEIIEAGAAARRRLEEAG